MSDNAYRIRKVGNGLLAYRTVNMDYPDWETAVVAKDLKELMSLIEDNLDASEDE